MTSDATPNDPVQRRLDLHRRHPCGNDRNLLDFIDVTTDDPAASRSAFADGCINACVTDPHAAAGRDAYATIARQAGGKTLLSAYDPVTTNVQLSSLQVTRQSDGQLTALVDLTNTGTRALTGLQAQVLDGRKQVGLTAPVDLAAGQTRTVSVTWKPSGAKSHTVTAAVDPANTLAEDDESDNKAATTILR